MIGVPLKITEADYALKRMYGYKKVNRTFSNPNGMYNSMSYEKIYEKISLAVLIEFSYCEDSSYDKRILYSLLYKSGDDYAVSMFWYSRERKEFNQLKDVLDGVSELLVLAKLER